MMDLQQMLDDFALRDSRRMTPKQLAKEARGIATSMLDGDDLFAEHPQLFEEPDPVKWGEAVLHDRKGKPQIYWPHQAKDLRNRKKKKAKQAGRDTGKTTVLITRGLHFAFTKTNKNILVGTPKKVHYAKIIDAIRKQFRFQPSLTRYFEWASDDADNPELRCLITGSVIYFRHGFPDGEAFRGLDIDLALIDEAAFMCERGWKAIPGCLRSDGDQRIEIFSNPDGRRNTTYFHITKGTEYHVDHWPQWLNPFWTEEKRRELAEFHNGENTPGFQHEVAGEHGAPVLGAFDEENVLAAVMPIKTYTLRRLSGADIADLTAVSETNRRRLQARIIDLLDLPERRGVFRFGGDLGYSTDPSELLLFEESLDGRWTPFIRVHCVKVPYPVIAMIIAELDRAYHPETLGLDAGNNGLAVYQELTQSDEYTDCALHARLHGFMFGASVLVGYKLDSDGDENLDAPIKRPIKEFSTDLLNDRLRERRIHLPDSDTEFEDQLIGQTYSVGSSRIVYSKGNDHINDALRTMVLAHWMATESPDLQSQPETIKAPTMSVSSRRL